MSEGTPNDPGQPRMPWEPETPEGGMPEPPRPPDPGWTPPEPADPTTAWTPPPAAPPAPGQAGLSSSAPLRWAPPPPAPGVVEVAPGLAFADTTSRAVAYIVDMIILGIVGGIVGSIFNPTTATTIRDLNDLMVDADPVGTILVVVIDLAYFAFAWTGGRRATIGQRLFSIQVGNAFDGRALSTEQAIRRTLALGGWISLIGTIPGTFGLAALISTLWALVLLITTATSPTKQGLHDRFANTALVRPAGQGTSGLAMACVIIVVVLLLLGVISVVALVLLGSNISSILSGIGESI